MKKLYSVKELEAVTSLKRTALFELLRRNELSRIKIGGRTCVTAESLDAFIARRIAAANARTLHRNGSDCLATSCEGGNQ